MVKIAIQNKYFIDIKSLIAKLLALPAVEKNYILERLKAIE